MPSDAIVFDDDWSRLADIRPLPEIDITRMPRYRPGRIRGELERRDIPLCVLFNPISLRDAADIRHFPIFQSHVPFMYLAVPAAGPVVVHGGYVPQDTSHASVIDDARPGRNLSAFIGGPNIEDQARLFANDLHRLAGEVGADNRRIAVEYVSPLATQALLQERFDVLETRSNTTSDC